ncbi:MAG TPA: type IV pilus assembly protein PilM [Tepidisphaeraceae bacterium]|nr:type IV pilus assembly protein PilM [Tepidisphaeraceae bacterium]
MANPRTAWGIDIGNRALKAIKLVRDSSGALRVDDFEVIEHENLLSNAGDNRESLIQSAMANFVQRHPAKGVFTAVSVSGSNSFARFIKLPPVEKKKIPEIVRFEAIQQIPFPLDDVEWRYQLFETPDSPDVEVGIFAMRKELVEQHIRYFTNVDLNVQCVQMNPLAVYNAMAYDDRIKGTTMIIDLGSENTDLIIADGETVWLRSIPIGGKNFTEILIKQFKLTFPKAEELKRTAATSKYAKQIFQAMRPVFADLVAEIQRSIGFYASVHRESRIKKVISLGGTFRLPGLQKYLQQNLQLDVERIDQIAAGAPMDAKSRALFEENLLSLASAYGLAVQAMGDAKIDTSLLPMHIRRQKMWKDKTPIFVGAAACFLAAPALAIGMYCFQNWQWQQNQPKRQSINNTISSAQEESSDWSNNVESQGDPDRNRIENIRNMFQGRSDWTTLTDYLYKALPTPKNIPIDLLAAHNWDAIKARVPRAKRDILLVESIDPVYVPNLGKMATDPTQTVVPKPGGYDPTLPPESQIPADARGFVLDVKLITPYGGIQTFQAMAFVNQTFISNLRRMDEKAMADQPFYIARASIQGRQPLATDATMKAEMAARYANWLAVKAMVQPNAQAPAAAQNNGGQPPVNCIDPNTGEDMSNDTTMDVGIVVILNNPPAATAQ